VTWGIDYATSYKDFSLKEAAAIIGGDRAALAGVGRARGRLFRGPGTEAVGVRTDAGDCRIAHGGRAIPAASASIG